VTGKQSRALASRGQRVGIANHSGAQVLPSSFMDKAEFPELLKREARKNCRAAGQPVGA
jgi:hypothetical protein